MNTTIQEIAQYCAERIEDYAEKVELALSAIGRHEPIDYSFRYELENCASDWAEENDYSVDFLDGIDIEDIIYNS